MDQITSAPMLPSAPTWDAGVLRARLRRLVRTLLATADALLAEPNDAASAFAASRALSAVAGALATDPAGQTQRLALLFTDIRDSSSLYRRFGDVAAARIIRAHFEWLDRLVQRFGGVPIKTMGDGALAAFGDDGAAVAAALAIQAELGALDRSLGGPGLVLRIGIHAGPCIVTRAGRSFDCFGTTVNVAARLLRLSQGRDIAISAAAAGTPAVAALLAGHTRSPAELRMPDSRAIQVLRVAFTERSKPAS